jgi:hypothetical protein
MNTESGPAILLQARILAEIFLPGVAEALAALLPPTHIYPFATSRSLPLHEPLSQLILNAANDTNVVLLHVAREPSPPPPLPPQALHPDMEAEIQKGFLARVEHGRLTAQVAKAAPQLWTAGAESWSVVSADPELLGLRPPFGLRVELRPAVLFDEFVRLARDTLPPLLRGLTLLPTTPVRPWAESGMEREAHAPTSESNQRGTAGGVVMIVGRPAQPDQSCRVLRSRPL